MNRRLGEVGDDSCMIPSSAFFVGAAQPAEAAAGIASGGHRPQSTMTGGDLLKAEHVTLDVGNPRQLMEVPFRRYIEGVQSSLFLPTVRRLLLRQ